jgi:hypothetical protein
MFPVMYPASLRTLLVAVLLGSRSLIAQPDAPMLRVTVLDAQTGEAIPGALVSAAAADSLWSAELVTDVTGGQLLRTARGGSTRVRVRRIGFVDWQSDPVTVTAGRTTSITARVASPRLLLRAAPAAECITQPELGTPTGVLWSEARKLLLIVNRSRANGGIPLITRPVERVLAVNGRMEQERPLPPRLLRDRPFAIRSPAALSRDGWAVRDSAGGMRFDLVDDVVLLSSEFEREHCLSLSRDVRPGLVGMDFAPVAGRTVADVAGTFWLDAASLALRTVTIRYRNVAAEFGNEMGGEVAFTQLPDGRAFIAAYRHRIPQWSAGRVTGARESASTIDIATVDEARVIGAAVGSLEGLVFDSVSNAALGDAVVRVVSTGQVVRSDPAGWFVLDLLPTGVHELTVEHPRLDSLALPLGVRVRVDSARSAQLVVSTASVTTMRQRTCPDTLGRGRDLLVLGQVRDVTTGAPVEKAGALLKWYETGKNVRGFFDVKPKEAAAFSEPNGAFRACVPSTVPFSIAGVAETMSGEIEQDASDARVVGVTLWVERDSAATARAVLSGTVRDSSGRSIFGATVALDGLKEFARTDSSGAFTLRGLPAGSRMLDIRRLGYAATRIPVVVRPNGEPLTVLLSPAQTLATRRVTGTRALSAKLRGFEERRRQGFGTFFDANQLDFFKNTTTTAVVRRVPSITVMRIPADQRVTDADIAPGSEVITMPSASQGLCYANIIIDGRPASQAEFWAYRPEDFVGLEVYVRASTIPASFGNLRNGCGAVVAWTK